MIHDMKVGDQVHIFSESLDLVLEGVIEGFLDSNRYRIKVLEEKDGGFVRHIVSWVYVVKDRKTAEDIREEYHSINQILDIPSDVSYTPGMTVHLRKGKDDLVRDREGYPYLYQIIRSHKNEDVSIVNSYGEFIGRFKQSEIKFNSYEPIISARDFYVGQKVSWVDEESAYEGVVIDLWKNKAKISNVKKLLPVDTVMKIDYYKLQSEDYLSKRDSVNITSIVGDNIDSE